MKKNFQSMAGSSAILVGLLGLAYAYYFVVAKNTTAYSLLLMLSGLFLLPVVVSLFTRLREAGKEYAVTAFVFGVLGAVGMLVHGGYDLANAINPPGGFNPNLPNQVDPRGLLVFGILGLAIIKFSWLMSKDKYFSGGISNLGYLSGALLVLIYIARLTVLNPANPILLYPVLLEGFIVGPIWYIWLGSTLRKD